MTDKTGERDGRTRLGEGGEDSRTPPAALTDLMRTHRISPETPLGETMLWRALLVNGPGQGDAVDLLTVGSPLNTNYAKARRVMPDLDLHDFPVLRAGHPDIAYVRFQERTVGPGALRLRPWFVTLHKGEDGWWRVWSFTAESRPAPEHVLIDHSS